MRKRRLQGGGVWPGQQRVKAGSSGHAPTARPGGGSTAIKPSGPRPQPPNLQGHAPSPQTFRATPPDPKPSGPRPQTPNLQGHAPRPQTFSATPPRPQTFSATPPEGLT
ncbi:unnamed protein product [Gadus morhua 'NCC']